MAFILEKNQKKCGNIFVWLSVIIATLIFIAFYVFPSFLEWSKLKKEIGNINSQNISYREEISRKGKKLDLTKQDFDKVAREYIKEEEILFPKSINQKSVAKIFELYSIQYSLVSNSTKFELNSISFSSQSIDEYTKTIANLNVKCNEDSLKDFIYFIQNNKLPDKLFNAQDSSSLLKEDIATTKFLRDNRLPIANIQSIKSSSESESDDILITDIQINFFSQKSDGK